MKGEKRMSSYRWYSVVRERVGLRRYRILTIDASMNFDNEVIIECEKASGDIEYFELVGSFYTDWDGYNRELAALKKITECDEPYGRVSAYWRRVVFEPVKAEAEPTDAEPTDAEASDIVPL